MVSNLYNAKSFYEKQQNKSIASSYGKNQKLQKDEKGFYLVRSKSNGDQYKQRVAKDDMVYTRAETGVTKYTKEADRDKRSTGYKESKATHDKHAHMGDRKVGSKIYRV